MLRMVRVVTALERVRLWSTATKGESGWGLSHVGSRIKADIVLPGSHLGYG